MTVHDLIEELKKIPNQNKEVILIEGKSYRKFGDRAFENGEVIIFYPPRSTDRVEVWLK